MVLMLLNFQGLLDGWYYTSFAFSLFSLGFSSCWLNFALLLASSYSRAKYCRLSFLVSFYQDKLLSIAFEQTLVEVKF